MTSFGSPGKDKMYKGSSHDTAWNHDLLWKLRVRNENSLVGISHADNKPAHVQRNVRIDSARSDYVRKQLETARSSRTSRPPTSRQNPSAMPREIIELERQIRQEISKRQTIEKKLNSLLEMMRQNDSPAVLPKKTKKGKNTKRVLDKISAAVAQARRTARSRQSARSNLPQVP